MKGIEKLFLREIKKDWEKEFPLLKPVHITEVPQRRAGSNFVCSEYAEQRGIYYFVSFEFSPKCPGIFTLSVTVSPSKNQSVLDLSGENVPSASRVGSYHIARFLKRSDYRWALVDQEVQIRNLFETLGVPAPKMGPPSKHMWRPTSFAIPVEQIINEAVSDVGRTLRINVFPILNIEMSSS